MFKRGIAYGVYNVMMTIQILAVRCNGLCKEIDGNH